MKYLSMGVKEIICINVYNANILAGNPCIYVYKKY